MTNTQLTDYNTTLFDEQVPCCPFCGVSNPEPGINGVNSTVCMACTENIHYYTPSVAYVYGDHCNFNIWSYMPVADTWDREEDPVFIDPVPREAYTPAKYSGLDISYADLPVCEQQVIEAVANNSPISERVDHLSIPVEELCDERVNALSPFRRQCHELSSSKIRQLVASLPRPSIFTPESIYTTDEGKTRSILTTTTSTTAQTSLSSSFR